MQYKYRVAKSRATLKICISDPCWLSIPDYRFALHLAVEYPSYKATQRLLSLGAATEVKTHLGG